MEFCVKETLNSDNLFESFIRMTLIMIGDCVTEVDDIYKRGSFRLLSINN